MDRVFSIFLLVFFGAVSPRAEAGLIRSIWACHLPCVSGLDQKLLGYIEVSYCGTSVLTPSMVESLNPLCQSKTGKADAKAARSESAMVGRCVTAANPCAKEGLVRSGFVCNFRCPSEDQGIRKYTACATTDDEAWSFAKEICKDAIPPDSSYFPPARVCTLEGQTPCE